MIQKEFSFSKGKRKFLFCADSTGEKSLHTLVHQAMEEGIPFDFHIFGDEPESFLDMWLNQQKMGSYLYISGGWNFVKRVEKIALAAGFSQEEMQMKVIGTVKKKLICCVCHAGNPIDDEASITCMNCGAELEVSTHYSPRLEAYLGYVSI
jgi:dimethylamine monooxygenase subunit C